MKDDIWIMLWLHHNWKVSDRRIIKAVNMAENLREIFNACKSELENKYGFTCVQAQILADSRSSEKFKKEEERFYREGIKIITIWDESYPEALRNIYDSPAVLYLKGNDELIKNKCRVAVVGTRKPSELGRQSSYKFSKELSKEGIVIVSGMATGIDRFAHMAGLEERGKSIGVLAGGIDICYPLQNSDVYGELAKQGLLLSEFYPGTKPVGLNFVRRNRIISGLSEGVLIVESGERSGSLITANYGLEQGKSVMAIPGAITNPKSKGCNALIKSGGVLVDSVEDILEEISFKRQLTIDIGKLLKEEKDQAHEKVYFSHEDKFCVKILEVLSVNQPLAINMLGLLAQMELKDVMECTIRLMEKGMLVVDKTGKYYLT